MNGNVDKSLDQLSRKIMGKSNMEQPSLDFTSQVMLQIKTLTTSGAFIYKPLISKWVWWCMGVLVSSIFTYVLFFSSESGAGATQHFLLKDEIFGKMGSPFQNFNISEVSLYAVLLFCLMLYVQIPIIKAYRKKRYNV